MLTSAHTPVWLFSSVIGLPGEEDWPRDVALPRQAFHSKSAQPIEKFVTDIDELGKDLLLVSSWNVVGLCHWDSMTSSVSTLNHVTWEAVLFSVDSVSCWWFSIPHCLSNPALNALF